MQILHLEIVNSIEERVKPYVLDPLDPSIAQLGLIADSEIDHVDPATRRCGPLRHLEPGKGSGTEQRKRFLTPLILPTDC